MNPNEVCMTMQTAQLFASKMADVPLTEFELELYESSARYLATKLKLKRLRMVKKYKRQIKKTK